MVIALSCPAAGQIASPFWAPKTCSPKHQVLTPRGEQHMRKNQYEEALFRCEDDRFELDMVIERNASAIRTLGPLVDQIGGEHPGSKAFRMQMITAVWLHVDCPYIHDCHALLGWTWSLGTPRGPPGGLHQRTAPSKTRNLTDGRDRAHRACHVREVAAHRQAVAWACFPAAHDCLVTLSLG